MAQRICDEPGCSKPHRARGLCSTHYNHRLPPDVWHPRVATSCVVCDQPVTRRVDSRYLPTCSVRCRTIVQFGIANAQRSGYEWRTDVLQRARQHGCVIVDVFDRATVFERDAWTCYLCDARCTEPDPYVLTAATVDHVVPFHAGGQHSLANARTACLSCNSAKQARIPTVA